MAFRYDHRWGVGKLSSKENDNKRFGNRDDYKKKRKWTPLALKVVLKEENTRLCEWMKNEKQIYRRYDKEKV